MAENLKFHKIDVEALIKGFDEKTKQEVYSYIKDNNLNTSIFHPNRYYNALNLLNYIGSIYSGADELKDRRSSRTISAEELREVPEKFRGIYKEEKGDGIRFKALLPTEEERDSVKVLKYNKGRGNKAIANSILPKVDVMIRDRYKGDYETLNERYEALLQLSEITKIEDVTEKVNEARRTSGHVALVEEKKREESLKGRIYYATQERREIRKQLEDREEIQDEEIRLREEHIRKTQEEKIIALQQSQLRIREELERRQQEEMNKLLKDNELELLQHEEDSKAMKKSRKSFYGEILDNIKMDAAKRNKDIAD